MNASLYPYAEMKASGVDWLGNVPTHWKVERLKSSVANVIDQTEVNTATGLNVALEHVESWTGRVTQTDGGIQFDSQVKAFQTGDVLFGKLRPYLAKVARPMNDGVCVGEFLVLRPHQNRISGAYLERLLRSKPIIDTVNSSTFGAKMPRADWQFIGGMAVAWPPAAEQDSIVRFLDHADRRIQRYIRAKQKLIALLEEQKRVTIHHVVTGQIDAGTGTPYSQYKDSGVEWLGAVPKHWEVKRLKWITRLQRGYDLPAEQRLHGPFPVISSGGIIGRHSESKCPTPGVVMGRYGSTDAIFFIEEDFWPHNTSLFVSNFHGNNEKWCYFLLGTITKADHAGKSAVPGIDRKDLFQIVVAAPPVDEQVNIVRFIENSLSKVNELTAKIGHEIESFKEFRTRLISEVVTGKLDIQNVVATLSEIDPDDGEGHVNPELAGETTSNLDEHNANLA